MDVLHPATVGCGADIPTGAGRANDGELEGRAARHPTHPGTFSDTGGDRSVLSTHHRRGKGACRRLADLAGPKKKCAEMSREVCMRSTEWVHKEN